MMFRNGMQQHDGPVRPIRSRYSAGMTDPYMGGATAPDGSPASDVAAGQQAPTPTSDTSASDVGGGAVSSTGTGDPAPTGGVAMPAQDPTPVSSVVPVTASVTGQSDQGGGSQNASMAPPHTPQSRFMSQGPMGRGGFGGGFSGRSSGRPMMQSRYMGGGGFDGGFQGRGDQDQFRGGGFQGGGYGRPMQQPRSRFMSSSPSSGGSAQFGGSNNQSTF